METRKIALVHDWLVSNRGGEKVLEALCELFPHAPLFTLVHREGTVSSIIENHRITTSVLQRLPFGRTHYKHYLPLFPVAARSLDLCEFDVVISSSHAAAKAVRMGRGAVHVCYCHTPMRYIWDQYEHYFGPGRAPLPVRIAMKFLRPYLQRWDIQSSQSVTHFIANSVNVQERIRRIYGRESMVIYPPVNFNELTLSRNDGGYYLVVSALVPYKRIDIAVEAFNHVDEKLIIVGSGSELFRLQRSAGRNIEFVGRASDEEVRRYYAGCRALIFPGEEDFGIVPVEAMACGKPVIAFGKGGACETVQEELSGVFFSEQTAASLLAAIERFGTLTLNPAMIRESVKKFNENAFKEKFMTTFDRMISEHT